MLKVVPKQLKAKPFTPKEKKPLADLNLSSNIKNVLNNHLNTGTSFSVIMFQKIKSTILWYCG